jgi:hypothetical protein
MENQNNMTNKITWLDFINCNRLTTLLDIAIIFFDNG